MGFLGGQELLLILLVIVVLFGAKKIPELARSMGVGIKELKKATKEIEAAVDSNEDGETKHTIC